MTSHLRFLYTLVLICSLGLTSCSNSLTTRGESQNVQTIDESFPDVDDELADFDTEDLSDEDFENFDDSELALGEETSLEDGDDLAFDDSELDFDDSDLAALESENTIDGKNSNNDFDFDDESFSGDLAANELENFSDAELSDELDSEFDNELEEDFDLTQDNLELNPSTADNGADPFSDFEEDSVSGAPENFVTNDINDTNKDPFADFLSEDLDDSFDSDSELVTDSELDLDSDSDLSAGLNKSGESILGAEDELFIDENLQATKPEKDFEGFGNDELDGFEEFGDVSDFSDEPSGVLPNKESDSLLADELFEDSSNSNDVFEDGLTEDFADVIDNPISGDLLTVENEFEQNKLTILEYNSQNTDGVIVLKAEKPILFSTQYEPSSSQYIVNLQNITVPSILQRPLYLKDFEQSFGAVKATPVSGGLVQIVVKVNNDKEPNVLTNGKELIISPGTDAIAGKISKVSDSVQLNPNGSVTAVISKNLNIPMTASQEGEKTLSASSLEEFLLETGTFYGDPINLQVNEEEIGTVIGFIADYSGANIVIAPGVTGKITIKLRNVPWDQALLTIMKTKGLGYVRTGNVLRIAPLDDLQKEALAAVAVRQSQIQVEATILKIIPLEYATSSEILPQVTPFLTKDRGTATEDKRTSSIVINDTKSVVKKVSQLIRELDLPPPQVLVEAKIVEATKIFAQSLGIRWGATGVNTQVSPTGGTNGQPINVTPRFQINGTLASGSVVDGQPFSGGFNFGVLDFFGSIDAAMGISETDSQIRIISSPRVTTLNNVQATITQSSEIIRLQSIITPGAPAQITPVAVPIALELKVTPQITSGSSVLMQLDVKNEFPGDAVNDLSPKNTRQAVAKVLVESNKTAVIGGIFDKSSSIINVGVPILKNIPLIGWLFKTKQVSKRDTEIMIFVTPRILDKNYTTTSSNKL